ncbi:MAG: hypothetical protein HY438_04260 [DPANN group archaeon]|nr:hypothetical protein [DPANN group archaeon]
MDFETIANVAVGSEGFIVGAEIMLRAISGAIYYFPTIAAPTLIYYVIKQAAVKYRTKPNLLASALAVSAGVMAPFGFLAGIITHDNWISVNNLVAYSFGAGLLAYNCKRADSSLVLLTK